MAFRAHRQIHLPLFLCLLGLCGVGPAARAEDQSKPAMTIVLERGDLLAGETISLYLWIENPTSAPMTDLRFRYAGPDFVNIGTFDADGKCSVATNAALKKDAKSAVEQASVIPLGSLQPGSVLDPPPRLCLQAKAKVEERDLSLGFSITYTLLKNGQPTSGFLVAEKKLSVGLFGTESVSGVSLRLAAYLVPGLLFMTILRLGGFPWLEKLAGSEVATLSILVSVFLFLIAAFVPSFDLTFGGVGSAVSATLFLALCIAAILISGLMVLIHRWIKLAQERKHKALLVETTDNDVMAFEKALRGASGELLPVTVVTEGQQRFVGSLIAPTSSGGVALLGWFQLRPPANSTLRPELDRLIGEKKFLEALALARENGIAAEMRDPVRTLAPDGTFDLKKNVEPLMRFRQRDVVERSQHPVPGLDAEPPLGLATP